MNKITNMRDLTLFAPSNEAWADSNLNNLIRNREKLREILNLHLVQERLPIDKIKENNMNQLFQVATAADRKHLYFNIIRGDNGDNNITLTVEGGGVNATVIQPNIAATNGIVHIIDRVLGVPYTTVREKLATDPMLNNTNFLGQQGGFNNELGDMNKRFTYFVSQILERHLVVADRAYTMLDLKRIANGNGSIALPTVRDHLKLRIKESDKSYYVEWQGEWIHVFRPDVECTNGIIHVIDSVFLKAGDVRVSGGGVAVPLLAPQLAMLLMAKWLLL
uniref:(California timema) hypothetical protein n=1 Tax=Timema californicum TaxID=61474 RepID=A0A7R9J861_TIMCA|nr:unnamed protein product [Timema californicum]